MKAAILTIVVGTILLPLLLWLHTVMFGSEAIILALLWLAVGQHFVLIPLGMLCGLLKLTRMSKYLDGPIWLLPLFAWLYLVACTVVYRFIERSPSQWIAAHKFSVLFPCIFLGVATGALILRKIIRPILSAKLCLTVLCALTVLSPHAMALSQEKGDMLYREKDYPLPEGWQLPEWFSHAGIYYKYIGTGDPIEFKNHLVIESVPNGGVVLHTFEYFFYLTTFYDSRTKNPTYQQRNSIIQAANGKIGSSYAFFEGYKGPSTFRCDGLGEYAYETAGIDILRSCQSVGCNFRSMSASV